MTLLNDTDLRTDYSEQPIVSTATLAANGTWDRVDSGTKPVRLIYATGSGTLTLTCVESEDHSFDFAVEEGQVITWFVLGRIVTDVDIVIGS